MDAGNPYDKAHELTRALQDSPVYRDYIVAQKKLALDPAALQKVQDFRTRQMQVNQASVLGQDLAAGVVSELSLQYAQLNRDELIAAYFRAEAMFVQMYDDIQKILQDGLEKGCRE